MSVEQFGTEYVFGFNGLTPPVIGGGFVLKKLNINRSPEFLATGTNGAGQVGAVAKPSADQDMIEFSGEGYIEDLADFDNIGATFTWNSRFFIIDKKEEPFDEKDYLVVKISGKSWKNVNG